MFSRTAFNSACSYLAALAVLVVFPLGTQAETNWSSFQNGGQNGAANPIKASDSLELIKTWEVALDGYGQSSPVVWNQVIYTTTVQGKNKEKYLVAAHDLANGKKIWSVEFKNPSPRESTVYVSKAAPTPVVDAAGIVVHFEGGLLAACSHDGKIRWQRNLIEEFGAAQSNHGLSSSLEQSSDSVFVWVERSEAPYILSVDKKTGKDNWKADGVGGTSWATPRLLTVDGQQQLLLSGSGHIVGLDPASGKQLWGFDGIAGNTVPTPIPLAGGKFLMGATTGSRDGGGNAAESNGVIHVSKTDDQWSVKYVWNCERATSSFGSPVAMNDLAYFVNRSGVLFALNAADGKEVFSQRLASSMWATPVKLGEALLFPCKNGTLQIISAGKEYRLLAETQLWENGDTEGQRGSFGGPVLYAAVVIEDQIVARRGDRLFKIQIK